MAQSKACSRVLEKTQKSRSQTPVCYNHPRHKRSERNTQREIREKFVQAFLRVDSPEVRAQKILGVDSPDEGVQRLLGVDSLEEAILKLQERKNSRNDC